MTTEILNTLISHPSVLTEFVWVGCVIIMTLKVFVLYNLMKSSLSCECVCPQVKPLLQVTRQEEEMGQKDEELKTAKEVAASAEAELKDISQKHTQVRQTGFLLLYTLQIYILYTCRRD